MALYQVVAFYLVVALYQVMALHSVERYWAILYEEQEQELIKDKIRQIDFKGIYKQHT